MGCAEGNRSPVIDSAEKYAPTMNEVQGCFLASCLINTSWILPCSRP